jgi:3-hydroxyisobutyrate dehydrogenase-like beta-hydroxyacid dehydrogenase
MSPIGFVGLGIMGEGMAARLLSQGVAGGSSSDSDNSNDNALVIWNRTTSKCTAFKEQFPDKNIIIADSPAQVVQTCRVTFCMLSTPEVSRLVFYQPETGVLAGVSTGKSIVDCATLAEADMQSMSQAVVAKGG